jgi:hypothetical protein
VAKDATLARLINRTDIVSLGGERLLDGNGKECMRVELAISGH